MEMIAVKYKHMSESCFRNDSEGQGKRKNFINVRKIW